MEGKDDLDRLLAMARAAGIGTELPPETCQRIERAIEAVECVRYVTEVATGAVAISELVRAGVIEAPPDHADTLAEARTMLVRGGLIYTVLIDLLAETVEGEENATRGESCPWPQASPNPN